MEASAPAGGCVNTGEQERWTLFERKPTDTCVKGDENTNHSERSGAAGGGGDCTLCYVFLGCMTTKFNETTARARQPARHNRHKRVLLLLLLFFLNSEGSKKQGFKFPRFRGIGPDRRVLPCADPCGRSVGSRRLE